MSKSNNPLVIQICAEKHDNGITDRYVSDLIDNGRFSGTLYREYPIDDQEFAQGSFASDDRMMYFSDDKIQGYSKKNLQEKIEEYNTERLSRKQNTIDIKNVDLEAKPRELLNIKLDIASSLVKAQRKGVNRSQEGLVQRKLEKLTTRHANNVDIQSYITETKNTVAGKRESELFDLLYELYQKAHTDCVTVRDTAIANNILQHNKSGVCILGAAHVNGVSKILSEKGVKVQVAVPVMSNYLNPKSIGIKNDYSGNLDTKLDALFNPNKEHNIIGLIKENKIECVIPSYQKRLGLDTHKDDPVVIDMYKVKPDILVNNIIDFKLLTTPANKEILTKKEEEYDNVLEINLHKDNEIKNLIKDKSISSSKSPISSSIKADIKPQSATKKLDQGRLAGTSFYKDSNEDRSRQSGEVAKQELRGKYNRNYKYDKRTPQDINQKNFISKDSDQGRNYNSNKDIEQKPIMEKTRDSRGEYNPNKYVSQKPISDQGRNYNSNKDIEQKPIMEKTRDPRGEYNPNKYMSTDQVNLVGMTDIPRSSYRQTEPSLAVYKDSQTKLTTSPQRHAITGQQARSALEHLPVESSTHNTNVINTKSRTVNKDSKTPNFP